MELHLIRAEHLGTQFRYDLTIHRYNTCLDELICLTTAADTCISQELVQTKGLIGIEVNLLILNALLHRILSIGIVIGSTLTWALLETAATIRFAITSLLGTLAIATLTLLTITTTLRTLAVTTLRALTITATLRTLAIATLRALTIAATLRTLAITTLRALTIAATLRTLAITALALLTIFTLLGIIVVTGTITTMLLRCATLQTCTKTFWAETSLVIVAAIIRTLIGWTLSGVNTWTW